jgi:UDP-N-acetylglucosamine/UDP-N-acetylgalactosamine 4-epimerase
MGYENIKFAEGTRFLVTGGAGFIGSNIVEAILRLGYKVRVLDNFSTGKKENIEGFSNNSNFELLEGDIRDLQVCKKACQGVDYVLHQAAWGSVPRSIEMPLVYEEINIKGTLNLMVAARDNKIKRFIYASSSSVYGDEPNLPKIEGREGKPLSPYAITKKVNELYARNFFDLYGLETIGLRYFNVFGKRQDPHSFYAAVIPRFIKALLDNEAPTIYGDGKQSRDFTYVENVVEANLKACIAGREAAGEAFNIAYGGRVYLINLYDKLCQLLNTTVAPNYVQDRKGDIKHSNADISKAKNLIGYNPDWSFEQGIEEAVSWYKENL